MEKQFRRILDLVRRTGDRMIVTDPDGENVYVVMDIDTYEGLIDMEDQVFEAFDEDSSEPMDSEEGHFEEGVGLPETQTIPQGNTRIWDHVPSAGAKAETWDMNKLSEEELLDLEQKFAEYSNKIKETAEQGSNIPSEPVENSGIEPMADAPQKEDEDDFGEEQFYLEPIE